MPPTLADRLTHILEAILSIEQLLEGKSLADIANSRHNRMILERELEVISEASRKIPDDIKAKQDTIDWAAIAALGNRLRHAYHRIDVDILYAIAQSDLPPLKVFIEQSVSEEKKQ